MLKKMKTIVQSKKENQKLAYEPNLDKIVRWVRYPGVIFQKLFSSLFEFCGGGGVIFYVFHSEFQWYHRNFIRSISWILFESDWNYLPPSWLCEIFECSQGLVLSSNSPPFKLPDKLCNRRLIYNHYFRFFSWIFTQKNGEIFIQ